MKLKTVIMGVALAVGSMVSSVHAKGVEVDTYYCENAVHVNDKTQEIISRSTKGWAAVVAKDKSRFMIFNDGEYMIKTPLDLTDLGDGNHVAVKNGVYYAIVKPKVGDAGFVMSKGDKSFMFFGCEKR